jgi:hypothetical protein
MRQTRRLAAILAADVAGYSRLMGTDEEGTLERLKALRRELLSSILPTRRPQQWSGFAAGSKDHAAGDRSRMWRLPRVCTWQGKRSKWEKTTPRLFGWPATPFHFSRTSTLPALAPSTAP